MLQRRGGPQFAALLERFGVKESVGAEITDDVTAVASVPRLDFPAMGRAALAVLGATDAGKVQLRNPTGSGIIVIVHRILVAVGAPDTVQLAMHNQALGTAVFGIIVWRPTGSQPGVGAQLNTNEGNLQGTVFGSLSLPTANETKEINLVTGLPDQRYPGVGLDEGRGMLVQAETDQVALDVTYLWSERLKR